ncbi:adenosylcobinamide kinase/adenosylcobinamide-phosphate guanylyltransferase [Desulfitispora alkaliphila]|uniref:bifunctional adenosylcobinamide kinase/adenosylcobinamide-phosphate guanylyltransferase n=1 Tax=Desulfitispora alkaliphila TaxID=622674 RepID=UPI003D1BB9A0
MGSSKVILITGGIRSGKSKFAEELVEKTGKEIIYLATAKVDAEDLEMKKRVNLHQKRRPVSWFTFEEQQDLSNVLKLENLEKYHSVLLDNLSNILTNNFFVNESEITEDDLEAIVNSTISTINELKIKGINVVIVTDEVGLSLVSPYKSGRQFQDYLGLLNQKVAEICDEVYLVVAGIPVQIKK